MTLTAILGEKYITQTDNCCTTSAAILSPEYNLSLTITTFKCLSVVFHWTKHNKSTIQQQRENIHYDSLLGKLVLVKYE